MTAHTEYLCARPTSGLVDLGDFRAITFTRGRAWGLSGDRYEIRDLSGAVVGGPYVSHPEQADGLRTFRAMVERPNPMVEATCHVCRGTGRNPMSDIVNWFPCSECGGTGNTKRPHLRPIGPGAESLPETRPAGRGGDCGL